MNGSDSPHIVVKGTKVKLGQINVSIRMNGYTELSELLQDMCLSIFPLIEKYTRAGFVLYRDVFVPPYMLRFLCYVSRNESKYSINAFIIVTRAIAFSGIHSNNSFL